MKWEDLAEVPGCSGWARINFMTAILTLTRYKSRYIFFALTAMGIFRPFLYFNRRSGFFRLLGCGKNGTFDLHPDWNQYGIFTVNDSDDYSKILLKDNYASWKKWYYGKFITFWWAVFGAETWTIILQPVTAHGKWGGREIFKNPDNVAVKDGVIAVLTRASIRPSKAVAFWKNVAPVEHEMRKTEGLQFSVGIGEMPVFRQATFSIWTNLESMKSFAYQLSTHREVIRKTREEHWYSEELFARFIPLQSAGTINGINPFVVEG